MEGEFSLTSKENSKKNKVRLVNFVIHNKQNIPNENN